MSAAGRLAPPRLLTIAGSDSGGGAGIQADLKTFAAHGVYGMSAITALTAQNTVAVTAIHAVPEAMVEAQLDAVFDDIGVDAVKIGMLSSPGLVRSVAGRLRAHRPPRVVLDPVMIAKSGAVLLEDDAIAALIEELLPLADLLTPNLPEAARLLGRPLGDPAADARALAQLGGRPRAVLLKGGHGEGEILVDLLMDGDGLHRFEHQRLDTKATHGTGCSLSSAIAARWALGVPLEEAVRGALDWLYAAIAAAYPIGRGHGPVDHLHASPVFRPASRDVAESSR